MSDHNRLPRRDILKALGTFPLAVLVPTLPKAEITGTLYFSCGEDNDLYRVAKASGIACSRYNHAEEAVARAPRGAGVLVLAENYPKRTTTIDGRVYQEAARKKLRLYVEFPSFLPGIETGPPRKIEKWERGVVSSDVFGPSLQKMRILTINSCRFIPVKVENPDVVMARVAGFDYATFGLPKQTVPILFELPLGNPGSGQVLVSTTKLSQFITTRYGPQDVWGPVWRMILKWLQPADPVRSLKWSPAVRTSYHATQTVPLDVEAQTLRHGIDWYFKAPLLVRPSWVKKYDEPGDGEKPTHDWPFGDRIALMPNPKEGAGDGSLGVLEGFTSLILVDGTQPLRWWRRFDCNGEVAGTLALAGAVQHNDHYLQVSANLGDYLFFKSIMSLGKRADPNCPSYGLFGWNDVPHYWGGKENGYGVYYGDDNARGMLGMMMAAAVLKTNRWDERLAKGLVANLRLTGQLGFHPDRIDSEPLERNGWRHYFDSRTTSFAPNYQAYVWAVYLWAYHHGGSRLFLERTRTGMDIMMERALKEWTGGIGDKATSAQIGEARMLLPLAWLVRVEDTRQHRHWLRQIAEDLLSAQDSCGAIRETWGNPHSTSPIISSNKAYGTAEGSIVQRNGDPATDLLYLMNFAFLGLHEAAAATGDRYYKDAEDRVAGFLCRVQVRSEEHPELNGSWFRAFDFKRWEFWGSNNDAGWGAWCTETGWMQSWITAVLSLRLRRTSLWDLTSQVMLKKYLEKYFHEMLPEDVTNRPTAQRM